MAVNVGKEIADLKQMTVRELREEYEAITHCTLSRSPRGRRRSQSG
jgi:hypothetical protein